MIKAILMDFNGVIIDDEAIQMRSYQAVLKERGVELTEEEYYDSLGMDDRTFVRAAFDRVAKAVSDEECDEIIAAKTSAWRREVDGKLPLFEGIEDFIEKMSRAFTLGIVSMANPSEIEYVLERAGLKHFFSTIVTSADVTKCKPDPEGYDLGFRRIDAVRTDAGHLPMTREECVVIEDSPPGVAAAVKADLQALGVTNTVAAEKMRAAGARATAKDLRDWFPESIRLVFSTE
ncbi:MAG: HAD family hydrolase [Acidobacteria bacterium OLB17]|nr:MAG: HAD family hydrolase [Acidobacteria bacterium OLB17]MCZ2389704.1 HAD family phosphatase [Acidobacteriota bacterium]